MSFAVLCRAAGLFALLWKSGVADAETLAPGGRHGEHGMVLFGEGETLYLSHIPMFRRPHDYQAVFVATQQAGTRPADPAHKLYTFLPDACSLDDLLRGARKVLHGQIYQGNFERPDGQRLGPATFAITRVALSRQLDAALPTQSTLSYFAFPAGRRVFLVHEIAKAPSFDQIVSVKWQSAPPQPAERVVLTGRTDTLAERLNVAITTAQFSNVVVIETLRGPDFTAPPDDGKP